MNVPAATYSSRREADRRKAARRRVAARRRRALFGVVAIAAVIIAAILAMPLFQKAVTEFNLPLQHEDIIRQQAAEKHLDPALIAAVIYAETKFDPRPSPAGAQGLMQIMPQTAEFLARRPRHAPGQHRVRQLLPALPPRRVPRQDHPRARGLQRRRVERQPLGRGGACARSSVADKRHPVPRDSGLRPERPRQAARLPPHVRLAARLQLNRLLFWSQLPGEGRGRAVPRDGPDEVWRFGSTPRNRNAKVHAQRLARV